MTDVAIVESAVIPNVADAPRTPLSWSAAIAGALAAMAVTFIMISLGSGIGLSFAPPYSSGPSATDCYVDLLFRPGPGPATAGGLRPAPSETVGSAGQSVPNTEMRPEVTRILVRSVAQAKLDESDRIYLAQVVSARTGVPPDE